ADQRAKTPEAAALFGDGDGEQRLALLADFGTLGDEAQAVEVHVGAAGDGDVGLALLAALLHVLLDRRDAERSGRLEDAARVFEDILDRGAPRIGIDDAPVVDEPPRQTKGLGTDTLDGRAVGEQADIIQLDATAGLDRAKHRVGIVHLHADDAYLRPHGL